MEAVENSLRAARTLAVERQVIDLFRKILLCLAVLLFLSGCGGTVEQDFARASAVKYTPDNGDYWQAPWETVLRGKGDCEDAAFYLWWMLRRDGQKAEVVFGFATPTSSFLHAWVEIPGVMGSRILDPTVGVSCPRSLLPVESYREAVGLRYISRKCKEYAQRTTLLGFSETYGP